MNKRIAFFFFGVVAAASRNAGAVDLDFKRGTIDWVFVLGGAVGVPASSETSFKWMNDIDVMLSPALGICSSIDLGAANGLAMVGLAGGVKFRFPSLYAKDADIGIRVQAVFDYLYIGKQSQYVVGAKAGPTFAFFATDKIAAAVNLGVRVGPILASGQSTAVGVWIEFGLGLVFVL